MPLLRVILTPPSASDALAQVLITPPAAEGVPVHNPSAPFPSAAYVIPEPEFVNL
jgi:hypothetical protein